MTIGFGWDDNDHFKYDNWMDFEKLFKKAYPDLLPGQGVTIKTEANPKYDQVREWMNALGRARRESLDELTADMLKNAFK